MLPAVPAIDGLGEAHLVDRDEVAGEQHDDLARHRQAGRLEHHQEEHGGDAVVADQVRDRVDEAIQHESRYAQGRGSSGRGEAPTRETTNAPAVDLDALVALGRRAVALLEAVALRRGHEQQVAAAIVVAHAPKPTRGGVRDACVASSGDATPSSRCSSAPSWPPPSPSLRHRPRAPPAAPPTKPAAAGKAKPSYKKPATVLAKGKRYAIVMNTTCGAIRIVLDRKLGGPIPNSIAFLATKHFFDGLTFHRVVADFVLQGGDPKGDGTGGPGYQVVGAPPSSYRYKLGDVAMAKTANAPSGAAGSQFFVISGSPGTRLAARPTACSAMQPTARRSRRSSASQRSRRPPAAAPTARPRSRSGSSTAKLVTLP